MVQNSRSSNTSAAVQGEPIQLFLKDKSGSIRLGIRDLLQQLANESVSTERISTIIGYVLHAFGFTLADSVSARTVSRIVLEGLIQAKVQIGFEVNHTSCE